MERLFFEYKKPSNDFFVRLWSECFFIFDTNVLLNFYRYSDATFQQLEESLSYYENRIWIPNQVATEFFKNRLTVIDEQKRNYTEAVKNIKKLKESLSSRRGHPFVSPTSLDSFTDVMDIIEREFDVQQQSLVNLINDDKVVNLVFKLFDNRVGEPYAINKLKEIYKEGKERYETNIPPGFKDHKKPEPDKYSDYVIWNQIIDKSIIEKKPVIFISDDEKEDWVEIYSNKVIGPLPKLMREFYDKTEQQFYLYQTFNFLKYSYSMRDKEVEQPIIDEIKLIGSSSSENASNILYNFHTIEVVIDVQTSNQDDLERFFTQLMAPGYTLKIQSYGSYIYSISLNVPFEDLVRRFHIHLISTLENYSISIVSFNSKVENNTE